MQTSTNSALFTLLHWIVSAIALLATAYLVPGFKIKSFGSALWAALFIGLANIVIWPALFFFTLPLNILTFGLFTFVINGVVLKICAAFLSGFEIKSWTAAIVGSVVLSLVGMGLHYVLV